jgi:hypothetical protein
MRKLLFALTLLASIPACSQTSPPDWRAKVTQAMPLLGHRNWILVVDSAYPLQSAPGIETIETGAGQLEVVRNVLSTIDRSIHVRPVIQMDAELPYLPEEDAPGVSAYRAEIADLLRAYPIDSLPHDQVIANVDEASRHFKILVLKTTMTVPYTSVFIRLDCKYWSAAAEQRLRARMPKPPPPTH